MNGSIKIEIPESESLNQSSKGQNDSLSTSKYQLDYTTDSCWRTLFALLFVAMNMLINLTVLAIIHERVPRAAGPLPDLGFDLLPRWDPALDIAEYLIVAQSIGVALLLFVHKYRVIIFRRLCLLLGILYLFRAICMASTQVPIANTNYYCSPQLYNSSDQNSSVQLSIGQYVGVIASRVFYLSIGFGLSINGRHSYCGDYLYSGHTVILTLSYLFFREYLIPSRCRTFLWKLLNILLFTCSIAGVISIIISRGHYLIDILLAYYITTRLFWTYHTLCYTNVLRFKSSANYLSRAWWWPLFRYFEGTHVITCPAGSSDSQPCNCCDFKLPKVPRSFEWPLPWPRTLRQRLIKRRAQRLLHTHHHQQSYT